MQRYASKLSKTDKKKTAKVFFFVSMASPFESLDACGVSVAKAVSRWRCFNGFAVSEPAAFECLTSLRATPFTFEG